QRVPSFRSVDYQRRRPCVGFHGRISDHTRRHGRMFDRPPRHGIDNVRIVPPILLEEVFGGAGGGNRPVLEGDDLSKHVFTLHRALDANLPASSRRRGAPGPQLSTDFYQVVVNALAIQDHGHAIDTVPLGNCVQVDLGATVPLSDRTGGWVGLHVPVVDAFPNPLDDFVIRNSPGTVLRTESPEIDQRSDGYIERTLSRGADPRCVNEYLEQAR